MPRALNVTMTSLWIFLIVGLPLCIAFPPLALALPFVVVALVRRERNLARENAERAELVAKLNWLESLR